MTKIQGTTTVSYIKGDISKVPADALITAINSGGMWFDGIDGVIQRCAGNLFHAQAEASMPLKHGQTVVARAKGIHRGQFANVVFVVDDLQGKLRMIVFAGLKAAADAGFTTVTLPAVRMGVMLGVVEKSPIEAATEIMSGIKMFVDQYPSALKSITLVIYNDPNSIQLLEKAGSYLLN